MFSDAKLINVILNILSSSPREYVSITPGTYSRHLSKITDKKVVRNNQGDISLILVHRLKAIEYLKTTYSFMGNKDVEKELENARSNI